MKIKILLILLSVALAACGISDAYTEAKNINDNTFSAAMMRICGPTAFLAASRQLPPEEQEARTILCAKYDARMLEKLANE